MSNSNFDFSVKFFRPPQRTVSCHNGLLDTRTKRTIAQDRLIVAEQRILDVEKRKSSCHLQSLAYEQKQIEKKLLLLQNLDQSLHIHQRSISEANLHNIHRITTFNDTFDINHRKLYNSNQNLLTIPKLDDNQQKISKYSYEDISENAIFISDTSSGDDEENSKILQTPIVSISPPEEENLFLIQ